MCTRYVTTVYHMQFWLLIVWIVINIIKATNSATNNVPWLMYQKAFKRWLQPENRKENMNECKAAVMESDPASCHQSEIALHVFTILRVCFIKPVDINLFTNGEPKQEQSW